MKECINRRYDESVLNVLEELRHDAIYRCSDPRLHIKGRERVTKFTKDAAERYKEDFENLHETINDNQHKLIGDRPLYNNFFVNVVKNLRAHLFMNCEAASIYEHRARMEEGGYEVCFHGYNDLMIAARIG